jgi:hypothetical protein
MEDLICDCCPHKKSRHNVKGCLGDENLGPGRVKSVSQCDCIAFAEPIKRQKHILRTPPEQGYEVKLAK